MKKKLLVGLATGLTLMTVSCYEAAAEPAFNPANGHYYEIVDGDIDWYQANEEAESLGGYLVTITDATENIFLTSIFGADDLHYHWIGGLKTLSDSAPDGVWSWVTDESFSFTNWYPGEPSGDGEDRIVFDHDTTDYGKGWNDLTGTWNGDGYVIEYDTAPVPIPSTILLMGTSLAGLIGLRRRKKA